MVLKLKVKSGDVHVVRDSGYVLFTIPIWNHQGSYSQSILKVDPRYPRLPTTMQLISSCRKVTHSASPPAAPLIDLVDPQ